jgi:acetyl-CoA carboxylase carboxyltransferase component
MILNFLKSRNCGQGILLSDLVALTGKLLVLLRTSRYFLQACWMWIHQIKQQGLFAIATLSMSRLVDLPGYLPGIDQEHAGVIRHGAKLLYAYSEATVPKITIILRKAYGGGYIAMCSHHLKADFVFAWPTAEIAVMGPEGAANIIFRTEIKNSDNPEATRKIKIKEYKEKFANPYVAAAYGYIDAVIEPPETRNILCHALHISLQKQETPPTKKHGIPPF